MAARRAVDGRVARGADRGGGAGAPDGGAPMTLDVAIRHRLERIAIDVSLSAGAGLTAIVGPAGAGKTTLLHAIAGLVRADEGRVVLGDDVLVDTARGVFVAPDRRRIGYVTQDSRLFPHLTVRQNLAYGHWFTRDGDRR